MKSFIELAESRYSVRKYKDIPVEKEKIEMILNAARLAPTACNYQPQKIYVVCSEEERTALKKVSPCTFDAPVVFIVGYDKERAAKGKRWENDSFGETDAAIVCTHMMLEAEDLGLGSCYVGWYKGTEMNKVMNIPENIAVCSILPVGYPADGSVPHTMHTASREDADMVEYR